MSRQKETVTFRLDAAKKAALDAIAAGMDRDRSYVLNQAVDAYLDVNRWQIEEIRKGLAEAEAGDLATAYIARDDPAAALRIAQRVRAAVDRLHDHPTLGKAGRVPGTRELVVP